MQPRSIIKTALLLFICASVIYLIAGGRGEKIERQTAVTGAEREAVPGTSPVERDGKQADRDPAFVAYYFHRDFRCQTCLKLEALCREAIRNACAEELRQGTLEWRVVNVDEPENEHFIDRFELYAQSLVVEKVTDGKPGEWKNLEDIWELMDDREKFMVYVENEVDGFLEDS